MARHGGSLGGPLPGMLAEYVVLPESAVVIAPEGLSAAEASTLPVAYLTAWFALVETGGLRAGEVVVLQGTGGVALAGLQIARAVGARTILVSRSAEKLARAAALGADHHVNSAERPDWSAAVMELTGGAGAQHVLEVVGGENLARSVAALAPDGRIAVIGFLAGMESALPLLPFMLKRAILHGVTVGHRRALEDLVRFLGAHGIRPVIGETFAFADLPAAFAALDNGPYGKIVVTLG